MIKALPYRCCGDGRVDQSAERWIHQATCNEKRRMACVVDPLRLIHPTSSRVIARSPEGGVASGYDAAILAAIDKPKARLLRGTRNDGRCGVASLAYG